MKPTTRTDTIYFTVKGQVVIPRWLRKEFEIDEGTRVQVYAEGDHITLPVPNPPLKRTTCPVVFSPPQIEASNAI
jgi:AbrB family looped-hinge helix DNA binding protein